MQHELPIASLLLIMGLAAALPLLTPWLSRLRMSLVVVEILAGMAVGRSGLNLIDASPILDFLTTFGFIYLMFLSGLEMDYGTIGFRDDSSDAQSQWLCSPLTLGLMTFGVSLGVALLATQGLLALGLIQHPFMIALILSTVSLGIVAPVLKEQALTLTCYGQTILVSAVVADFATMLLITVAAAAISGGVTLNILLVLLLLVAFVAVVRLGHLAARLPSLQRLVEDLAHTTAQIQVRGAFALLLGFIGLSQWVGTEIILGAFLAGAGISMLMGRAGSLLHQKMDTIGYGFFIPLFFIMVGVRFDLSQLLHAPEIWILILLLVGIAYGVKLIAVLLVYRLAFSWRETLAAGTLLSAQLSLTIAAAAIALDLGAITAASHSAFVVLVIVTCILSPVLFNALLPPPQMPLRRGVIVVGLGPLSVLLAERLQRTNERVTLVGRDAKRVAELTQRGLQVVQGTPTAPEVLQAAGADTVVALMALSSSDEENLAACCVGQEQFGIPNIIALATNPTVAMQMSDCGIRVVQPHLATILALEGAWYFPETFDLLANSHGVAIREALLSNASLHGRSLRRIDLPGGVLVLGLRRGHEALIPHGDTVLRRGDVLMLIGNPEGLEQALVSINPFYCAGEARSSQETLPSIDV